MTQPRPLLRARLASILGAVGLAVAAAVVHPAAAQADSACTITGFSPRTIVAGLAPVTSTFRVSATGCQVRGWELGNEEFHVNDTYPQVTFLPMSNAEAGPMDVLAVAYNADSFHSERFFVSGLSLKRRTAWQRDTFNASPEPVRSGGRLTIKGRLLVADWSKDRYAGYGNRNVRVQFRTATGAYATVKTVQTRADGWLVTTVTARKTGVWRVQYAGNSVAGGSVSAGDSVQVTG